MEHTAALRTEWKKISINNTVCVFVGAATTTAEHASTRRLARGGCLFYAESVDVAHQMGHCSLHEPVALQQPLSLKCFRHHLDLEGTSTPATAQVAHRFTS